MEKDAIPKKKNKATYDMIVYVAPTLLFGDELGNLRRDQWNDVFLQMGKEIVNSMEERGLRECALVGLKLKLRDDLLGNHPIITMWFKKKKEVESVVVRK